MRFTSICGAALSAFALVFFAGLAGGVGLMKVPALLLLRRRVVAMGLDIPQLAGLVFFRRALSCRRLRTSLSRLTRQDRARLLADLGDQRDRFFDELRAVITVEFRPGRKAGWILHAVDEHHAE